MSGRSTWRNLEIKLLGAILGALVGAVIVRRILPQCDDAVKLPTLIAVLSLSSLLGLFLVAGGPTKTRRWMVSAVHRLSRTIRQEIQNDTPRAVTMLLNLFLPLPVAIVLFEMSELVFFAIPLALLYLMIAWGLSRKHRWVIGLARWTHGFILAVAVILTVSFLALMTGRPSFGSYILAAALILVIVISGWTLWYAHRYQPQLSPHEKERPPKVGMLHCILRTAVMSVFASFPLAGLMGLLFRFPVMGGYASGPQHVMICMITTILYGVYGGVLVQAAAGCVGGYFVYRAAGKNPEKRDRLVLVFGILSALPGLVFLATWDWLSGWSP